MFKHLPLFCVTLYFYLISCDASVIMELHPFEIRNSSVVRKLRPFEIQSLNFFNSYVDRKPESKPVLPLFPVRAINDIKPKLEAHIINDTKPKAEAHIINDIKSKLEEHGTDFLNLIDVGKVIRVFFKHTANPDVVNLIDFISSKEFKNNIQQFQDIKEFKELVEHLKSKGYNIESVIDFNNPKIGLPAFGAKKTADGDGSGVTTLIKETIAVLPLENFKKLFKEKLEKHKDLKDFFSTLSSKEVVDIIVRLRQNPKYLKIRNVFKRHGVDFVMLEDLAKDIFGDYLMQIDEKVHGKFYRIS